MSKIRKAVLASAAALLAVGLSASAAHANWSSYLNAVGPGFKSRTWADKSYTEINFTRCSSRRGTSTNVELEQYIPYSSNPSYGSKRFTACFGWYDGDDTSTGTWNNLPSGTYYFKIAKIDDGTDWLSVDKVHVDTTKAD